MQIAIVFLFLFVVHPANAYDPCLEVKNIRMQQHVIASNIANALTTRVPDGGPYQRQYLICKDQVCNIQYDTSAPIMKYEPQHPDANENGYVAYPNIDVQEEMDLLLSESRAYVDAKKDCVK